MPESILEKRDFFKYLAISVPCPIRKWEDIATRYQGTALVTNNDMCTWFLRSYTIVLEGAYC